MKHQHRKHAWIALALALLLLAACGAAAAEETAAGETAFVFRNGVTWDMTMEQVKEAEGAGESDFETETFGDTTMLVLMNSTLGDEPVDLAYYFMDEQLIVTGYYFPQDTPDTFAARTAMLSMEYGDPAEVTRAQAAVMFNAVAPGSFQESYIVSLAGWALADGTQIFLLDLEGDIGLFCFNAPVLLDGDE